MSINGAKNHMQSGFFIWLVSLAGVSAAVIVSVLWLDRPIALLAYGWFGHYRSLQRLTETPSFFGPLEVLAFAVLVSPHRPESSNMTSQSSYGRAASKRAISDSMLLRVERWDHDDES